VSAQFGRLSLSFCPFMLPRELRNSHEPQSIAKMETSAKICHRLPQHDPGHLERTGRELQHLDGGRQGFQHLGHHAE